MINFLVKLFWAIVLLILLALPFVCFTAELEGFNDFFHGQHGAIGPALGGAYVAGIEDSTALFWNPASIIYLERGEISSFYNRGFEALNVLGVIYYPPVAGNNGWVFSVLYDQIGDIPRTEMSPEVVGEFSQQRTAFTATFATKTKIPNLNLGTNLRFFQISLDDISAHQLGIDFGINYRWQDILRAGVSMQNLIGSQLDWEGTNNNENIPLKILFGVDVFALTGWNFYTDFEYESDSGDVGTAAGVSFKPLEMLKLRAGIKSEAVSLGTTFFLDEWNVNYAFVQHQILGNSHHLSLKYDLGKIVRVEKEVEKIAQKFLNYQFLVSPDPIFPGEELKMRLKSIDKEYKKLVEVKGSFSKKEIIFEEKDEKWYGSFKLPDDLKENDYFILLELKYADGKRIVQPVKFSVAEWDR